MFDVLFSWKALWYAAIILYVPACIGLIIIVLLQKGKGAGFAGSFGAGAGPGSETVFGPRAGQTLPVKMTYLFAIIFVAISLGLSIVAPRVRAGDAPELAPGDTGDGSAPAQISTGLDELGIGTGRAGEAPTSETESSSSDE